MRARRELARGPTRRLVLFAVRSSAELEEHLTAGNEAWFVDGGDIVRAAGADPKRVVSLANVPVTHGGALRFNVENALAAAAAAHAMGVDDDTIAAGLGALHPDGAGVPGRGNTFVDDAGRVVVIDFAHNPAALLALWQMLLHIGQGQVSSHRVFLVLGAPGDRQDSELVALATAAASGRPDLVVVRELRGYLRGRRDGEVPNLLTASLKEAGVIDDSIVQASDDVDGIVKAIDVSMPGDVIAITPIVNLSGVLKTLHERGFRPRTAQ